MRKINFFHINLILIVFIGLFPNFSLAENPPCNNHYIYVDGQCKMPNDGRVRVASASECAVQGPKGIYDGYCRCATNYKWTYYFNECKKNFGAPCTSVSECLDDTTIIGRCDMGVCGCVEGMYYWVTGIRCGRPNTGSSCMMDIHCHDTQHGGCKEESCECNVGYKWDITDSICKKINDGTQPCDSIMECYVNDSSGLCDGMCKCANNNSYKTATNSCGGINNGLSSCTLVSDCVDSSVNACCTGGKCTCVNGFGWKDTAHKCVAYNDNINSCTTLSDCYDQNAKSSICNNGRCSCLSWSMWNPVLKMCLLPNDNTANCENINECVDSSNKALCSGTCKCALGYFLDSITKQCKSPNDNVATCTDLSNCVDNSAAGACTSGKCTCAANYGWVSASIKCLKYNNGIHTCSTIGECYDQSQEALCNGYCTCIGWSVWDNTIHKCRLPNDNSRACNSVNECLDNTNRGLCNTKCTCKAECSFDSSTKKCKAPNSNIFDCSSVSDCIDSNTGGACTSGKCTCATNFSWSSISQICKPINNNMVAGSCTGSDVTICFYNSPGRAACVSGKCSCSLGFLWHDASKSCKAANDNTVACVSIDDCFDSNVVSAQCNGKCTCQTNNIWDNNDKICKYQNANALASAILKDEWSTIELTFASSPLKPTGYTDNSKELCDYLFNLETTNLLGTKYTCELIAEKIIIHLGQNSEFNPSSIIHSSNDGIYFQSCSCSFNDDIQISQTISFNVKVTARISPESDLVDPCTLVTITLEDIQGIGNRQNSVKYSYQVLNAASNIDQYPRNQQFKNNIESLNQYLSAQGSSKIIIPGDLLLESGHYVVNIIFKTYFGEYITSVAFNTSPVETLVISVNGNHSEVITIFDWEDLVIIPQITVGKCKLQKVGRYFFNWTQQEGGPLSLLGSEFFKAAISNSTGIMKFPKYSLFPENYYAFNLIVTHYDFPLIQNHTSVLIKISRSMLTAKLINADQTISVGDELELGAKIIEDCIFVLNFIF